jgi:hypothetical protein
MRAKIAGNFARLLKADVKERLAVARKFRIGPTMPAVTGISRMLRAESNQ